MNKLLIVLLAVCLFSVVSAHTFVKRDAPTDDVKAQVTAFNNKVTELAKQAAESVKQAAESVSPDVIKKTFNDAVDTVVKTLEKLKSAPAAATAGDAKPAA